METAFPVTLQQCVDLGILRPVEGPTASILRPGDKLLWVSDGDTLRCELEKAAMAVQVVVVKASTQGQPAVEIPGESCFREISCFPRGAVQTWPRFYYMKTGGPVPRWVYRAEPLDAQRLKKANSPGTVPWQSWRIAEDPELAQLARRCSILPYDVLELFLKWFMSPNIGLAEGHGSTLLATSSGKGWRDFYEFLHTQFCIASLEIKRDKSEVKIPTCRFTQELLQILSLAMRRKGLLHSFRLDTRHGIACVIQQDPLHELCKLYLYQIRG